MDSENLSGRRRRIWFWGIGALVILLLLCLWLHGRSIPRDIEGRLRAALTAGGADPALLSIVDGRDVVLTGEIDDGIDRRQLVATARSLRGVRSVTDNLKLVKPADASIRLKVKPKPAQLRPPNVTIVRIADRMLLQGELADQNTLDKIAAAAGKLAGVANVENQLTIGENIGAAGWVDGLVGLLPALMKIEDARVAAGTDGLSISGTLSDEAERAALLIEARQAVGELALHDRLVLQKLRRSASLSMRMSEDALTLEGELPDATGIALVLSAVHNQYGTRRLVNTLAAGDAVGDPGWLDGALQLFGYLANIARGGIEVDDRGAVLVGDVADPEQRNFIARRAKALLEDLPIDNRIQIRSQHTPVRSAAVPLTAVPLFPPLFFKHGSTELVEASRPVLAEVVELLQRYPQLSLEVGAHTDAAGDDAYNLALSKRRAQDMISVLTAAGIENSRLIPKGYGEHQPMADNATGEGRALNRRIELKVLE